MLVNNPSKGINDHCRISPPMDNKTLIDRNMIRLELIAVFEKNIIEKNAIKIIGK